MGELAVKIEGADTDGFKAIVSKNGELLVRPLKYSKPYYILVDTADTPFEVVPAISGMMFVITGLLLASSKTFGSATTGETLTIYEAHPSDLSTNKNTIVNLDMFKNDRATPTGLFLITNTSNSLVASATDTDVNVTIAGYYVEA
jgi:hypothetical protein